MLKQLRMPTVTRKKIAAVKESKKHKKTLARVVKVVDNFKKRETNVRQMRRERNSAQAKVGAIAVERARAVARCT